MMMKKDEREMISSSSLFNSTYCNPMFVSVSLLSFSFSLSLSFSVSLSFSLCLCAFLVFSLSLYVCMCVLVSEFPFIPLSLSDYLNNSSDLLMTKFFVSDMHNHTNEADNYVYLKAAFYINEADMHIRQD